MVLRVGILFGGRSSEHEVSLRSAQSVLQAIDRTKYEVVPILVDKEGVWWQGEESLSFFDACATWLSQLDLVFPIFHGPYGEDGSMQGLFEVAGIPYVGASVLGSAIGLDKDVMKRLLRDAGVLVAKFLVYQGMPDSVEVKERLGFPCYVKPANMGSSIGITKVWNESELTIAAELALLYDKKIIIEENITGREIACSILGGEELRASLPGELIPKGGTYSYANKYIDPEGATFILPAPLSPEMILEVQESAMKAFRILCCDDMARVDFFLTQDNRLYLNEINTIPGFTSISLYPKLWEISGLPYSQLIDELISFAMERKTLFSTSYR